MRKVRSADINTVSQIINANEKRDHVALHLYRKILPFRTTSMFSVLEFILRNPLLPFAVPGE